MNFINRYFSPKNSTAISVENRSFINEIILIVADLVHTIADLFSIVVTQEILDSSLDKLGWSKLLTTKSHHSVIF